MPTVYEFVFPKGKRYVGMTMRNMEKRMIEHRRDAKRSKVKLLYKAVNKYEWQNITINVLFDGDSDREMICLIEQEFIAKYKQDGIGLYNMTDGGEGGLNRIITPEARINLSAAWTPERKEKFAITNSKTWTQERKEKHKKLLLKRWSEVREGHREYKPYGGALSDEQLATIIELLNAGSKPRQIADELRINRNTIQAIATFKNYSNRVGDKLTYETNKNHVTSPKLTEDQVKEIKTRFRDGETLSKIHKDFTFVGKGVLKDIRRGHTWQHVLVDGWHPISFDIKEPLTEEQVLEIKSRLVSGEKQTVLANEYNVNSSFISMINTGKRYSNVK